MKQLRLVLEFLRGYSPDSNNPACAACRRVVREVYQITFQPSREVRDKNPFVNAKVTLCGPCTQRRVKWRKGTMHVDVAAQPTGADGDNPGG